VLDLLVSVVLVVLVAAVGLALAVALTVAPFVVAVDMAERRRFSTARWGGLALAGSGLAAVLLLLALLGRTVGSLFWVLLAVVLGWGTAGALSLLSPAEAEIGGAQGAHEH
jgi:hypothetical protein